jgi:hypothetical protein
MLNAPSFILMVENAANFFDSPTLFSYLCIVKKLMFIYLNESYPNVYIYRCKFGDALYNIVGQMGEGRHVSRRDIAKKLTLLFSCDESDSYDVFDSWSASRPVYVRLKSSTNETVLVPLVTECNSTVS